MGHANGDDRGGTVSDPILTVDSRGGVILQSYGPRSMTCAAEKNGHIWRGTFQMEWGKPKMRIYLKGPT